MFYITYIILKYGGENLFLKINYFSNGKYLITNNKWTILNKSNFFPNFQRLTFSKFLNFFHKSGVNKQYSLIMIKFCYTKFVIYATVDVFLISITA